MNEFRENNNFRDKCCQLTTRQTLPDKQLILLTDESFQAAGYVVLTEVDPNQKVTSTRKTCATVPYGSKTFTLSLKKLSIYAKESQALYLAFKELGRTFWETSKPVMIMTDGKSVTRFSSKQKDPTTIMECM